MKIAICDDEPIYIETTSRLLQKWAGEHGIEMQIFTYDNGDDLIAAHTEECMDLILLDVIMPLLNGIDTAAELRANGQDVPIIFLTSSREFAVESYEVKAFHYLLKPIDEIRLFAVMDEYRKQFCKTKETFTAQTVTGFYKMTIEEVACLEAQNKLVLVTFSNGTQITIREPFYKCEEIFHMDRGFIKCHRSYIVNLMFVEQFTKTEVTLQNGMVIPISRNNYAAFKEVYFRYMFQK